MSASPVDILRIRPAWCLWPVLLMLATAAPAQKLYRCGSTFSQTPCAQGAEPIRVTPAAGDAAPAGPKGKDLCEQTAVKRLGLLDTAMARLEIVRGKVEVIQYAGQGVVAVQYRMSVFARNEYGAYGSAQRYSCYLSEDEQRVLQISPADSR